jgi:cytochrome oxidase Cu insertion factor (SCO1/SenC/PrrC family)
LLLGSPVAIATAGVHVTVLAQTPSAPPPRPIATISPFDEQTISPPVPAPPVSLRDYRGRPVSLSEYQARGQAVLLTFVASRCPAGCPIAAALRQTLARMPASERARLQIVAVSLDPRGDWPASVAAFLARHRLTGSVKYLIGSVSQLRPVWTEWNVGAVQAGTAVLYGIDASGEAVTSYSAAATVVACMREVVSDDDALGVLHFAAADPRHRAAGGPVTDS